MISRAIATNGLPLKIQTEWTDNDYWERIHPDSDDMRCVNVAGWLVRINGKKYPRGTQTEMDIRTGHTGTHQDKGRQKQAEG